MASRQGLKMRRGKGFLTYESPHARAKADRMEAMRTTHLEEPVSSADYWRNAAKVGKRKNAGKRVAAK